MNYDCMTPDEYAAWLEASERVAGGGPTPCVDCPMWFAIEARATGSCRRFKEQMNRRNRAYRASLRSQVAAARRARNWSDDRRRAYNREWMRRYRERHAA